MKKTRLLLTTITLVLVLAAAPAQAATFTVNSKNDAPDANAGNGVCATAGKKCTLRAAIEEANALDGDDIIKFAPDVEGTITLVNGQLTIDSGVTIEGPGAKELSVSGDEASRVFFIGDGGVAKIKRLTIENGKTPLGETGGGIHNELGGTLILTRSILSDNSAFRDLNNNDPFDDGGSGGAIYNKGTTALRYSTISANSAERSGGGIINRGTLQVLDSVISGNHAIGNGGGIISVGSATLHVRRSTLSGNSAANGGGIGNTGGLKVRRSTLSGNSAVNDGGGISNAVSDSQKARVINSTITGNSAEDEGGGVNNHGGKLTVTHGTIFGNSAGISGGGINQTVNSDEVNLSNTIIARNPEGGNCANAGSGAINDQGYNIDTGTTCSLDEPTSLSGTKALLAKLAKNGGPAKTHALKDGSPAINLIPKGENGCGTKPQNDQRGVDRPQGKKCDAGSFEKEL